LSNAGTDQVHAIRPAYIVLAGLGAGNILLVIVALSLSAGILSTDPS